MTICIDQDRCNGCMHRREPYCEEICPGDLFVRVNGKATVRDPAECWDCFACVKACPRNALWIELPFQVSETHNSLSARIASRHIIWTLRDKTGTVIQTYTIQNRTSPIGTSRQSLEESGNERDMS